MRQHLAVAGRLRCGVRATRGALTLSRPRAARAMLNMLEAPADARACGGGDEAAAGWRAGRAGAGGGAAARARGRPRGRRHRRSPAPAGARSCPVHTRRRAAGSRVAKRPAQRGPCSWAASGNFFTSRSLMCEAGRSDEHTAMRAAQVGEEAAAAAALLEQAAAATAEMGGRVAELQALRRSLPGDEADLRGAFVASPKGCGDPTAAPSAVDRRCWAGGCVLTPVPG